MRQMAVRVKTKTGKNFLLLNPSEKFNKYRIERKHKMALTNAGKRKLTENGRTKRLTEKQLSYRAGYMDALGDSAKAWKHNKEKKRY